jgi:8-oxo-dGTP pyrophosphatase MutT (NUDIX family)
MLRKNSKVAFGGMWVFPGGRVDDADYDAGPPGDDFVAAKRAAAREALEEADLVVDVSGLVTFSHWTPPEESIHGPKRFLTWFFVCRAPVGEAGEVTTAIRSALLDIQYGRAEDTHNWLRRVS